MVISESCPVLEFQKVKKQKGEGNVTDFQQSDNENDKHNNHKSPAEDYPINKYTAFLTTLGSLILSIFLSSKNYHPTRIEYQVKYISNETS